MERALFWLYITTFVIIWTVYQFNKESHLVSFPSGSDNNTSKYTTDNTRGPRASSSLQLVIIMGHHGNRASDFSLHTPFYPLNDTNIWPYGASQLTNSGRLQMYKLGRKLRTLYDGFISRYYGPEHVMAYSPDSTRQLMSAELLLAGLFPPSGYQVWNKDLMWQPIPVYPTYKEHSLRVAPSRKGAECPRFQEVQTKYLDEFNQQYSANITDLIDYVERNGLSLNDVPVQVLDSNRMRSLLFAIWETLVHVNDEGWELPDWSKRIYPDPISLLISKVTTAYVSASYTQIKLFGGEIFQEMINFMQEKVDDSKNPKHIYYYSIHDWTIFGMMNILGRTDFDVLEVKTGSALILELHRDPQKGSYYVQVLFINGASADLEPTDVNIPACAFPCDFHQLLNITEKYYNVTDWVKECHD
uniref:acid phosphatase n=1 Tax=Graphocephala atropunctata TaxID=36148 RepID=A0A1B6KVA7_9HEMI